MKPNSQIYVSIIVAILSFLARPSEGYVLTRCDNFRTDIKNGLADFLTSVSAARSSVTVEYHDNEVIDWFGLLDTLYPGLKTTPLLLNKLRCACTLVLPFFPTAFLSSTFQVRVMNADLPLTDSNT